jgi:hypothetical protein
MLVLAGLVTVVGTNLATRGEDKQTASLAARLKQPVDFKGIEADPKMTFQEALDVLAKDYGLKFDINEAAFREEMVDDVESRPVVEKAVPKMSQVPLETVVRKILARVPAQSTTTYIIRHDAIEVTTGANLIREIWGPGYEGPYLPLANRSFDRQPLEEALKDLAASCNFNIVLDSRAAEKARLPVTARFENTPLDTAVRLLADMADLRPFLVDNVLYVTTPERADRMEAKERERADENPNAGKRVGTGRWLQRPSGAPGA